MTKLDLYETNGSSPPEVRESEARASRIHSLLKLRDKAEAEIAAVLREHLDAVGEPAWLAWCEREFGWKRTAAYRHLNPELLQKHREDAKAERSHRGNIAEPEADALSLDASKFGNPSIRPMPLDTRSDEERESAMAKCSDGCGCISERSSSAAPVPP